MQVSFVASSGQPNQAVVMTAIDAIVNPTDSCELNVSVFPECARRVRASTSADRVNKRYTRNRLTLGGRMATEAPESSPRRTRRAFESLLPDLRFCKNCPPVLYIAIKVPINTATRVLYGVTTDFRSFSNFACQQQRKG